MKERESQTEYGMKFQRVTRGNPQDFCLELLKTPKHVISILKEFNQFKHTKLWNWFKIITMINNLDMFGMLTQNQFVNYWANMPSESYQLIRHCQTSEMSHISLVCMSGVPIVFSLLD